MKNEPVYLDRKRIVYPPLNEEIVLLNMLYYGGSELPGFIESRREQGYPDTDSSYITY